MEIKPALLTSARTVWGIATAIIGASDKALRTVLRSRVERARMAASADSVTLPAYVSNFSVAAIVAAQKYLARQMPQPLRHIGAHCQPQARLIARAQG